MPTHAQVGRFSKRDPRTESHGFAKAGCNRVAVVEGYVGVQEKCLTAVGGLEPRKEVSPPPSPEQEKPVAPNLR